jgi:hypothetical protein
MDSCGTAIMQPSSSNFLRKLECEAPDTELLIIGDTFGFWELTYRYQKGTH